MPGIDRSRSASTSSRSSQVPCSRISPSGRRRSESQRRKARGASISTASRNGRTFLGVAASLMPSASPREWAGSVETRSTRSPALARATAYAEAVVVLPTPPLPAKKTQRGLEDGNWALRLPIFVSVKALDVYAADLVVGRHGDGPLL